MKIKISDPICFGLAAIGVIFLMWASDILDSLSSWRDERKMRARLKRIGVVS